MERLRRLGFDWERFVAELPLNPSEFGRMMRIVDGVDSFLITNLTATSTRIRHASLERKLRKCAEAASMSTRHEAKELIAAITNRNANRYRDAYAAIRASSERQTHARRRRDLLRQLQRSAATWASCIEHRKDLHGHDQPQGDPCAAWEWRQLHDELTRRAQTDIEDLQGKSEWLRRSLADTTVQLIECRAWSSQIRRTKLRQRQALTGWLDTVRRIGRGTGKNAPRLRREANRMMTDCRDAVPVWIMPLARLVEHFNPTTTQFDVVIIDEASQCDVMALIPLTLAKQLVVVGDHEQVSPLAVGQKDDIVNNLIREYMSGIQNSHLYDGRMSVYDLARQSFGGTIRLREHFRCVADIIQFSNHLSYNGEIRPLRDDASVRLRPSVVPFRVEGASRSGKVNHEEAKAVASLIVAMTRDPDYADQTIGVVSLVGEDQAKEIDQLVRQSLPAETVRTRRIACGNSAQFQGDERDIMLLSVVDVPQGGPLRMTDTPTYRQRLNVAASRARNQLWVVYSVNPEIDLKPGDLRRRLIEHALDPSALTRELDRVEALAESPFEQAVIQRLVQAGYKVIPQWKVGFYRIDIVVEGENGRLAVECDGDRFHPIEKIPEDMARQATLERLGWRFHRIRGSEYYRSPEETIQRLKTKLTTLGIEPRSDGPASDDTVQDTSSETVDRVIRSSAAIRQQWSAKEGLGEEADFGDDESVDDDVEAPSRSDVADHGEEKTRIAGRGLEVEGDVHFADTSSINEDDIAEDAPRLSVFRGEDSQGSNSEPQSSKDLDSPGIKPKVGGSGEASTVRHRPVTDSTGTRTVDGAAAGSLDIDATTWFALAKWAKDHDHLTPWDRRFAYSQGVRIGRGNAPSDKQERECQRILFEASTLGFDLASDASREPLKGT
ncbi:AAA domain-containing protein [Planctomycetes bacterium Pan216]|uniref:AAA domain-containing protein n=1 Tax=Kolteria novifilia TaxID=2527975 RepID=UPI0011A3731A